MEQTFIPQADEKDYHKQKAAGRVDRIPLSFGLKETPHFERFKKRSSELF